MAIPTLQLKTWSNPGAAVGSAYTYQQIKSTLESNSAPYAGRDFEIFLQGSYGNSTNIYSESDVDIVIELQSECIFDIDQLPPNSRLEALQSINRGISFNGDVTHNGGIIYGVDQFKKHVFSHLKNCFGNDVIMGSRAINIKENGNRRSADVIVCISFKLFIKNNPYRVQSFDGIFFNDTAGNAIINYPKYHADNCTEKNLTTGGNFKQIVRIFKNMRGRLIDLKRLDRSDAPSYFLECMLWNVPNNNFSDNYQQTIINCLNWLNSCAKDQLLCANKMYFLFNPFSSVTWREEKFNKFLSAAINFWNNG